MSKKRIMWRRLGHTRTCPEKEFAWAMLDAGVVEMSLSKSGWCGEPLSRDGVLIDENSICARASHRESGTEHPLWQALNEGGVHFSGGQGDGGLWAQASWSSVDQANIMSFSGLVRMRLPMVVIYFQQMQHLQEARCSKNQKETNP
jgi:hypothetical protein